MKVSLIDYTTNPVLIIGRAMAVCYGLNTNDDKRAVRRVISAMASGHDSVLRFAYATFNIEEISRVCSQQLLRIAHAGALEASQRHISGPFGYVIPPAITGELREKWIEKFEADERLYLASMREGIKKEDARYCLPQGTQTKLRVTGNFQMWKHFLKLRLSTKAQWEVREVAEEIKTLLVEIAPEVFDV